MNNFSTKSINDNLLYMKNIESLLKKTIFALANVEKRCDLLEKQIKILNEMNDIVENDNEIDILLK